MKEWAGVMQKSYAQPHAWTCYHRRMHTFDVAPCAALAPYVDRFWGWEAPRETVNLPLLLPGTGAELFFHYGTPFRYADKAGAPRVVPRVHLLCLRGAPLPLLPTGGIGFLAVRFAAGAVHRFTRVPGPAWMDEMVTPGDLWGPDGRQLVAQVMDAGDPRRRIALVQLFLLRRLQTEPHDALVAEAVGRIYREAAGIALRPLETAVGYRQMVRRFRAVTGQTPVDVRQASRLQKAVRTMLLDPGTAPLDAALAQGFYDQSHFIRAFRAWSGMTPAAFLRTHGGASHFYNTSRRPG